ncbi:MAG TPA: sensor histidine kinase [Actinomycetota bacterium]
MTSEIAPDRRVTPARWPWFVVAGFFLIAAVASWLVHRNGESLAEQVPYIIAFGMFGVVGALIVSRAPGNRIGVLLLWGSGATAVSFLAGEVVTLLARGGTRSGPAAVLAAIVSNVGWVLGLIPALILLPLLFPDGRPPSPRWRLVGWIAVVAMALLALEVVFVESRLAGNEESIAVRNPLAIPALRGLQATEALFPVVLLSALLAGLASLVARFYRARGAERQQVKWVAASAAVILASFVASALWSAFSGVDSYAVDVLVGAVALVTLPVAIGVGVLQYRLYDLDVVVTKTLIAGSLFLLVVVVYATLVWALGASATAGESSAWLFVVALVLGIAFRPVTGLARRVADRLVYGRRATPYEVLTEFSERVGDAYATDDILGRMAQILGQGVGAASARVWLLVGAELRPETSWPSDASAASSLPVRGSRLPELAGEDVVEVRDRGELLGALSVLMPQSDPMTPAKEKLVRDLASQAGLVLRNVRLVEELRALQRRLVTAQDQERRRIERNIHDGAQQQLVALTVKARLARQLADRDAGRTAEMLLQIEAETQTALEDLRDLARGIYPPLLADKGLSAALEAQARRGALRVEVSPDGIGRYSPEVEAAVYFSVLEALQNVAKYARASGAEVRLEERDGWLTFHVADDGVGFDPAATGYGTGLQGIADRLSALGGRLEVRSRPGEGSVLEGHLPVTPTDWEPARQGAGR